MRQWVRWAARNSAAVTTVSEALKHKLVEIGVDQGKVTSLRNGVDLEKFSPCVDGNQNNENSDGRLSLLSVGHLLEDKGHHLVIDALIKEQYSQFGIFFIHIITYIIFLVNMVFFLTSRLKQLLLSPLLSSHKEHLLE